MSKTFSPRSVEPGALKRWHKDAMRLLGRLGIAWALIWCLGLPALALWLDDAVGGLAVLVAFYVMQVLGVVLEPIRIQALDRAATAQSADPVGSIVAGASEILSNPRWYLRRCVGQALALFVMFCIIIVVVLSGASGSAENSSPDPYAMAQNLMLFLLTVPAIMRRDGIMSFDFFLRARAQVPDEIFLALAVEADRLNRGAVGVSVLLLLFVYLVPAQFGLIGLFLLPVVSWYHAAFVRCAYHDIFEGGTGVEEKARQPALAPATMAA